jgi:uncharacterized protein (DUF433 family)
MGAGRVLAMPERPGRQSKARFWMATPTLLVSRSPDVLGGTPVFVGTRVPVQTLLDYLEAGDSIDDFLDGFPTVSRKQVIALLEEAAERLVASAA